jgi:Asp-tRNA(Asn)/Glu-tRNA(Gln) amidotransferase A subunit family amidase
LVFGIKNCICHRIRYKELHLKYRSTDRILGDVMSRSSSLCTFGVSQIVAGVRAKDFSAEEVVRSCLARIDEREQLICAWTEVDRDAAVLSRAISAHSGPLCGVPFGIKDVIDSSTLTTEMGSKLYEGHRARFDASCVATAKQSGAIALGKTVTAEFAGTQPTRTRNPHDIERTPGGSSSGSAAAVADFMVPFAFGTQTGGSVLRPAAFCGIVGFKPSFGLYSTSGVKTAAHSFDTIGLLARSVDDVALLHSVFMNASAQPTVTTDRPILGIFRSHLWETVTDDAKAQFERAAMTAAENGAKLVEIATPAGFETITTHRAIINAFERAHGLAAEWTASGNDFSRQSREVYERGIALTGDDYLAARHRVDEFRRQMDTALKDIDALITPTTSGEAPVGLAYAGDPRLQELWTMLHLPSITIPAGAGEHGMPIGLQLVGRRYADRDLLGLSSWLSRRIDNRPDTLP